MSEDSLVKQGVAKGSALGGAVLLITVGVLEILQGISAISEDDVTVVGPEYAYQFDLTSWGWIHLVLGVLVTAVGIMLFTGATWARVGAIVICSLSILANFLWLPHSPWWSIIIIALDVFVIWPSRPGIPRSSRGHPPNSLRSSAFQLCASSFRPGRTIMQTARATDHSRRTNVPN